MNQLMTIDETSYQLKQLSQIKDNYSNQCRHWVKWIESNGKEINRDSIKEYFEHLDTAGYKAKSINVMRQAVKKRVRQLFKDTGIEFKMRLDAELKEIDQECKAPKINSEQIETDKVLSKQDYKEVLNKCRSDRQKTFIMFLFITGCRVNELTGITLSDCNDQGDYFIISVMGKGKKARNVRIDKDLYNYIVKTYQSKKYLFETTTGKRYQNDYISKQIKKIGVLIGRKISAHSLRHSFVTGAIKAHPDKIDAISRYVGHSDVSITISMYNHTSLSNEDLFSLAS